MKNFILKINRALVAKKTKLFTLFIAVIASVVTIFAQQPLISIDGNFDDWSAVPSNILAQALLDLNSNPSYDGLFAVKFCMDDDYIFFYLEYSAEKYVAEHFDICMDLDGDGQGFNWWLWDNSATDCMIEYNLAYLSDAYLYIIDPKSADPGWPWADLGISNFIFTSDTINLLNGRKAIEGKIVIAMISPEIKSLKMGVFTSNNDWIESGVLPQSELLEVPCNSNYLKVNIGGINYLLKENDRSACVTYDGYDLTHFGPFSNYSGEIIIPNLVEYNGKNYTVTSIGSCAFRESSLTSINIPNSVTRIGEDAFFGCPNLTSIYVPCGEFDRFKALTSNDDRVKYLPSVHILNLEAENGLVNTSSITICDINVQLTPLPNYGYHFVQWNDGITNNPRIIELTQDTTFTAEFAKNIYSITKETDLGKGSIFGPSSAEYLDEVELTVTSNYGYHFTQWSDGNADNPRTFVLTKDTTFTAIFAKNTYSITKVANSTQGSISGVSQAEYLDEVTLTANPKYGYHFVKWSDGVTDNPRTIELTQDTTFTAEFAHNPVITYVFNSTMGNVSGPAMTETGIAAANITFEASANYGYHFTQWSDGNTDNPRTIWLSQDTTMEAVFAKNSYAITTAANNSAWGTTVGDTTALYLDEVQISAASNYGYHFVQWNDGNTSNPRTITVTEDKTYTAIFVKNIYSVTKQCNSEQGSITGILQVQYLDYVTLTAEPNYGYHFTQWSDGLKDNPRIAQITRDTTFTAEFAYDRVGTCGKDWALVWSYDPIKKVLTIGNAGSFDENMRYGVEAPNEMTELVIGNNVTAVGTQAFAGLQTLTKVTIGESVKTIGEQAFYNCVNLESITNYRATPTNAYSTAFDGVDKFECKLYVLPNSIDMYKNAAVWRDFYYTYAIGAGETTATDNEVTVDPSDNMATFTWPTNDNAASYTIQITKDGVLFCTLIFNANGQLTGIAFAPSKDGNHHAPSATLTANGMQFTVTGLNSGTHYAFDFKTKDAQDAVLASYTGEFTTTGQTEVPTDIDQTTNDQLQTTNKVIRDGRLFILRGDKTYTITGQEIR